MASGVYENDKSVQQHDKSVEQDDDDDVKNCQIAFDIKDGGDTGIEEEPYVKVEYIPNREPFNLNLSLIEGSIDNAEPESEKGIDMKPENEIENLETSHEDPSYDGTENHEDVNNDDTEIITENLVTDSAQSLDVLNPNFIEMCIKEMKNQSTLATYKCSVCDEPFNTKLTWKKHLKKIHNVDIDQCTKEDRAKFGECLPNYNCIICGKHFKKIGGGMNHIRSHETDVKCGVCGMMFRKFKEYKIHMRHHDVSKHQCNICKKSFTNHLSLERHVKTHSTEKVKRDRFDLLCEICSKVFHAPNVLALHLKSHQRGPKAKHCSVCGINFKLHSYYRAHVKKFHNGVKDSIVCNICKESFDTMDELKAHKKEHGLGTHRSKRRLLKVGREKREYHCEVCGYRTYTKDQHVVHMRTHTGEKPFVCDQCGKSFRCPKSLKMHSFTHSNIKSFTCHYCEMSFKFPSCLLRHAKRVHTGILKDVCSFCGQGFTDADTLKAHRLLHKSQSMTPATSKLSLKQKKMKSDKSSLINEQSITHQNISNHSEPLPLALPLSEQNIDSEQSDANYFKSFNEFLKNLRYEMHHEDENNNDHHEMDNVDNDDDDDDDDADDFGMDNEEDIKPNQKGNILSEPTVEIGPTIESEDIMEDQPMIEKGILFNNAQKNEDHNMDYWNNEVLETKITEKRKYLSSNRTEDNVDNKSPKRKLMYQKLDEKPKSQNGIHVFPNNWSIDVKNLPLRYGLLPTNTKVSQSSRSSSNVLNVKKEQSSTNMEHTDESMAMDIVEFDDDVDDDDGDDERLNGDKMDDTSTSITRALKDLDDIMNDKDITIDTDKNVKDKGGNDNKNSICDNDDDDNNGDDKMDDISNSITRALKDLEDKMNDKDVTSDKNEKDNGGNDIINSIFDDNGVDDDDYDNEDNEGGQGKRKRYKCEVCHQRLSDKFGYQAHLQIHKRSDIKEDNPKEMIEKYFTFNYGLYTCKECAKTCRTRRTAFTHSRTHSGIFSFTCEICNSTFQESAALKKHYMKHSGERNFKCSHCPKSFVYRCNLQRHVRIHTGEKKYCCETCGSLFPDKGRLNDHVDTVHKNGLSKRMIKYKAALIPQCPICGKFVRDIDNHMKKHRNERDFVCAECGKSYSYEKSLKQHAKTHSGVKEHVCSYDGCRMAFYFKSDLKRHEDVHKRHDSGSIKCELCVCTFYTKKALNKHMLIHNSTKKIHL